MRRALMFLVIITTAFAGYNDLLICHTDPGSTSGVQTNIGGYPYYDNVTLMDCTYQTPSLDTMLEYGCVFTWSNYPYADPVTFGDNLADYMDQVCNTGLNYESGGVVSCCFAHNSSDGYGIAGRYASDAEYCPVTRGENCFSYNNMDDYDDTHPILEDVEVIFSIQFSQYITKESPATWLADLTNGYILAAVNGRGDAVGINLYPGDYHYWSGDGWTLYNNAIVFVMEQVLWDIDVWGMEPDRGDSGIPVDTDIVFHCTSYIEDGYGRIDTDTIVFTVEDQSLRSGDKALRAGAPTLSVSSDPRPAGEISGTLDIDDSDHMDVVCTFTPDEDLPVDLITCTVDGCLADIWGHEMGEDFVWTFTTGNYDMRETSWGRIKAEF
jgi:hypothetical protein